MPLASKAQEGYLWAHHPGVAQEFEDKTSPQARRRLPEHVSNAADEPGTTYDAERSRSDETDPTMVSLERLNDLSRWHVVDNVPILDEHVKKMRRPKVDAQGRPVIGHDGKPETEEVEFVCDKAKLQEIADVNNLREEATGSVSPIMIGHVKKETPEIELGPIVGYQRHYRVGTFGPENKTALLATWQIYPNKLALAKEYPRPSVELWPHELIIDPVAILKRTPERDLGTITYQKGGTARGAAVTRQERTMSVKNLYAKGGAPYRYEAEPEAAKQPEQQQPDEEKLAPEHEEIANAYMRHYEKNHPVMKYMKSCYEKDQTAQAANPAEQPVQNEAAQVSGTNGEVPQPIQSARDSAGQGWNNGSERKAAAARMTEDNDWDSKQEHAKKGAAMQNQRSGQPSQYAKELEARLAKQDEQIKTLIRAQEESKCRLLLKDLDDEGFKVNYEKDTRTMLPMSDAERVSYAKELRDERARRDIAPVARNGFIRTAETEPYVPAQGNISEAKFDEAVKYQKEHPEIEDFNVCMRKVGAIR